MKNKVKELEKKVEENLNGWQKALADYQNLEKEVEKRMSSLSDFNKRSLLMELLPIFDSYKIAIVHIPEEQKKESWAIGLEHILQLWKSFLKNHKVEKIKSKGKKFDPHLHEAVGQINDNKEKDQIITEEKLAGYRIEDTVIRPAQVIINNKIERK